MSGEQIALQIVLMVVLVALSAFFSATETAYSSLNRARLKTLAERGDRRAANTLALAERYDELLSTILVGNNIVNIALASVGTLLFVTWLGGAGVPASTAVVTVVVLVFGEVSPKSLAKESPERFAMAVCPVVRALVRLLKPVNWLFTRWKRLLSRLFGVKDAHGLTQDELLTIVEEAEQEGGMNAEESELLKSAIEFRDVDVSDILTPRVRVDGVPLESTAAEVADRFEQSGYSRLPVYEETLDHIVGVVHQKDFFKMARNRDAVFSLADIIKKPVYVSPGASIGDTLRLMQKTQSQMAVVADEYGGTVGILTMEDILEELVGEIWDEHDEVEEPIRPADGGFRVLGSAEPEDVFDRLQMAQATESSTMSGWVMEKLERVPAPGDSFDCEGWRVCVLQADGRHVQELELTKAPPACQAAPV